MEKKQIFYGFLTVSEMQSLLEILKSIPESKNIEIVCKYLSEFSVYNYKTYGIISNENGNEDIRLYQDGNKLFDFSVVKRIKGKDLFVSLEQIFIDKQYFNLFDNEKLNDLSEFFSTESPWPK